MSYWTSMLGGRVSYWDIDGASTRVLEAGKQGERLLLCVHGSGGHAENFVTSVVPLSQTGHVVAPDLLGHGLNSRPASANYTMRGVLDHLRGVIDAAGGRPVSVIGLSLGGVLAAQLAREHKDVVERVVMVCPSGLAPGPVDVAEWRDAAARMRDGTKVALEDPTLENCRKRVEHLVADPSKISEEMVVLRQHMYTRPGAETMLAILQDNIDHVTEYVLGDQALSEIDVPTLIIWGRHNRGTIASAEQAAAQLKRGQLEVFENSGHWPHVEEQELFHTSVRKFLDQG